MRRSVVLVLRTDDAFSNRLRESGCEVINLELIRTEPVNDRGELDSLFANIIGLDGFFFTSPVAATVFLDGLSHRGLHVSGKIYVLGERTKRAFEDAGLEVEYRVNANTAEELIGSFDAAEFAGKRLLFVRGDKSMRTIPELLGSTAEVIEAVVYRTVVNTLDPETVNEIARLIRNQEIEWACFFSPSAVEGFISAFSLDGLGGLKAAVIGETTARKVKEYGFTVGYVSTRATAADFAEGLIGRINDK